jgi:hypothetical protein
MVEPGVDSYTGPVTGSNPNHLYTFDEEQGAFIQKIYDSSIHNFYEDYRLIPESRLAEFE